MKKLLILTLLLLETGVAFSQIKTENNLKKLSEQHQFVKMDSLNNKIRTKDYYFYKALFANVCNKPDLSNLYLDSLNKSQITKEFRYYKLKNDNYIKLFDYANAFKTSGILTSTFSEKFTKEELDDELNTRRIWEVLKLQKPQIIDSFSNLSVATKKDKAGLITTNVLANTIDTDFVFDTGAGISCITESLAKKLGFIILPDNNIEVMSFTGVKNKVLMGIAPVLNIGDIKIHNAVFLVYPDSAFTFANGKYVINGIIGFPIIKELGTVTIEENSLTFSKNKTIKSNDKNLFIDELRAIVMLNFKGKTLPFNFDSGAKTSSFNKSFYELFKTYLDKNSTLISAKTASAGGQEITSELLELKDQQILLGKNQINVPKLQVDKSDYGVYGKVNYGNIGQDIIGQFKKVTISFDHNYLKLEN
ncbi:MULTISPECIES: retropepsin-like aspartic protease [unclassified Flavobacterium]|uniref:retropepsin-like aspartic protease n=1 Tax=unclassified Flavobacterium TaxID=196869 RepID=UPI002B2346EC|nr:retropepsin-like aspartic protease [Flavobacterium sp. PL02]MEA9414690.1 retropepsin-like aspartic protease [Flavobacterium sp. PL02]